MNLMLYSNCPSCGSSEVEGALEDRHGYNYYNRSMHTVARAAGPLGAICAPIIAAFGVASVVRTVYGRVPGGGTKRCKACNRTFR